MIATLVLPPEHLEKIARGRPTTDTLDLLRAAEAGRTLLLIRGIVQHADGLDDAVALLEAAERTDPVAVRELLSEPIVGVWAARCTRDRARPDGSGSGPEHLRSLAAVAAHRAGVATEIAVPGQGGRVMLPTLGLARSGHSGNTAAVVRTGPLEIRIGDDVIRPPDTPGVDGPGWCATRHLNAHAGGRPLTVSLDDLDPHRNCYRLAVTDRCTGTVAQRWATGVAEAWNLLVQHAPEHATEIAAVVRTIVPIVSPDSGTGLSATSRDAFGSIASTVPADGVELAVTLVHEGRHAILNALLNLVPLLDSPGRSTYFAPWRPDPRPAAGLLHGTFAFIAVAQIWSLLRPATAEADVQFARIREQVRLAAGTLRESGELTSEGRVFVDQMRQTAESLMEIGMPNQVVRAAEADLRDTYARWREANPGMTGSGRLTAL